MTLRNFDQNGMRIDKWLWAARFYKTRGLAQTAVAGGKVKLRGERVKPAKEIGLEDELSIHIGEVKGKDEGGRMNEIPSEGKEAKDDEAAKAEDWEAVSG